MEQKILYCPKCKKYPLTIQETYLESIVEIRHWDGDTFELIDSNIGDIEYSQECMKCKTILEYKSLR